MSATHARACVFALLAGVLACAEEPPPDPIRPVLSMVVEGPTAVDGRWWPGRAKATLEVDLGFEVSGQLVERSVKVGDEVKAGTVMARVDPRDFENALLRARDLHEDSAAVLAAIGEVYLRQERYLLAVQALEKATALDSTQSRVLELLAAAQRRSGQ